MSWPKLLNETDIRKHLRWLTEQIRCLKSTACVCDFQETSVVFDEATEMLTIQFVDGSSHSVKLQVTAEVLYTNEEPLPVDIGGYLAGTTFLNKNTQQMWDGLLYPELFPILIAPTRTFTVSPTTTLFIAGSEVNLTFTATFNRGAINPAYGTDGFRAGLPNEFIYTGPGLPANVPSSSLTNVQSLTNFVVQLGLNTWTSRIAFDAGQQPLSNKGNNFDAPLSAGTTAVLTRNIEGVYPLFATSQNISTLTQQALVSMLTGNNIQISLVSETSGNKQKISIPNAWLSARPLVGIQVLNTVSNNFEFPGGSASASLALWAQTSETLLGQPYTRFTHIGADRANVTARLIF